MFGAGGQLGRSLQATDTGARQVIYAHRADCDLADEQSLRAYLDRISPGLIINAAAYTAVDRAGQEAELATRVNARAPAVMADYSARQQAGLIHISTDFVFDGEQRRPYLPSDPPNPLGEYGKSKLAGELAVSTNAPEQAMIIRTSWVYSEYGNNFVKTMLRLMADRDELGVVNDQRGSPLYARGLAEVIWEIISGSLLTPGIFHWSDEGNITWYEFAQGIQATALECGLLDRQIPINPLATRDYPTPQPRPPYSVLDNTSLARLLNRKPLAWKEALSQMLQSHGGFYKVPAAARNKKS